MSFFSGLTNLASSALGYIGSRRSTREQARTARYNTDATNRANRELAEYAYSKDLEMWKRQNKYNTPAEQQKRFQEAGLNPNLMYGQGTPGQASEMPKYQAPRMDYAYKPERDPLQDLGAYMNMAQQTANIDLTKRKIETEQATEALKIASATKTWNENDIASLEAEIARLLHNNQDISDLAKSEKMQRTANALSAKLDSQIKKWQKGLTDNNINPNDPTWIRQLIELLEHMGITPSKLQQKYIPRGN